MTNEEVVILSRVKCVVIVKHTDTSSDLQKNPRTVFSLLLQPSLILSDTTTTTQCKEEAVLCLCVVFCSDSSNWLVVQLVKLELYGGQLDRISTLFSCWASHNVTHLSLTTLPYRWRPAITSHFDKSLQSRIPLYRQSSHLSTLSTVSWFLTIFRYYIQLLHDEQVPVLVLRHSRVQY